MRILMTSDVGGVKAARQKKKTAADSRKNELPPTDKMSQENYAFASSAIRFSYSALAPGTTGFGLYMKKSHPAYT